MLLDQSTTDVRLQLTKTNFLGKDGFTWWVGQVALLKSSSGDKVQLQSNPKGESLYYNRVKVRIIGYHTANCSELKDEDLPWAHIMIPAGQSNGSLGNGSSHEYKGGESVIGFFLDGDDGQQPVILGSLYKHSGVQSQTDPKKIESGLCSSFKTFEPTRIANPSQQNTKVPAGPGAGTNPVTKVETAATNPEKQKPGLETTVTGIEDKSRAAEVFSQKSDDCTQPVTKCEQDSISRITTQIDKLMKDLSNVQKIGDKYVNKVTGKINDYQNKVNQIATTISSYASGWMKEGRDRILKDINIEITKNFDKLFPKTKQAEAGNKIRTLTSTLYCLFKKFIKSIFGLVSKILQELIGEFLDTAICVINNFISNILNTIFGLISSLINPIISAINLIIGGGLGSISSLIQKALGIANIIKGLLNCEAPPCESESQKFCMSNGPSLGLLDSFPSSFGAQESCGTTFECGPPSVQIFGGGGFGAVGNAVINEFGQLIGINLVDVGFNYTEPPLVSLVDSCHNGSGAIIGSPTIINGSITTIPIIAPGSGYLNTITTQDPGEDPVITPNPELVNPVIPEIDKIEIIDGGVDYAPTDTIQTSNGCTYTIKTGGNGSIISVESSNTCGPTGTTLPEVTINTDTGVGAILVPVLKFKKVGITEVVDPATVIQIIDCVQK